MIIKGSNDLYFGYMCQGVCSLFRLVLFVLGNYALALSVVEETFDFINLSVCKLLMFLSYRAVLYFDTS
jgi:hypothetical protein